MAQTDVTSPADVERGIMKGYLTECEVESARLRRQNTALREAIREHIDLDNDGVLRHESTCQTQDQSLPGGYPCDCGHDQLAVVLAQADAPTPVDDSEPAT